MLADRQHRVDRQVLSAKAQRLGDCRVDGDLELAGHVPRHVVRSGLIDVEADDVDARVRHLAVEQVRPQEVLEDHMGVAAMKKLREQRRHARALCRLSGNGSGVQGSGRQSDGDLGEELPAKHRSKGKRRRRFEKPSHEICVARPSKRHDETV